MPRKPEAFPNPDSHAVRVAWWASFCATIAVIAILGVVRSAQAAAAPLGGAALALAPSSLGTPADDESAEGGEEVEGEECEAEEDEEECVEDASADESSGCILRSASATVSAATAAL